MHSRLFGCLTKLGAKRVYLVQKFVPRSNVRIFWNECSRFTPLDPKMMFWCISYYLGADGTVRLPYETRCKTGRTNANVCATKSHWKFSQQSTRSTTLDPKLMFSLFCTIWVHLGPFGCLTKLGAKRAELVQNFVPWSRIGIFRNKRTWSTPLDTKLMFCWVL